jgi:hypothetical protein
MEMVGAESTSGVHKLEIDTKNDVASSSTTTSRKRRRFN